MTLASASRTAFRSLRLVRICRSPPIMYPTRPCRIAVSFTCTRRVPSLEPSPHKALAALQRWPTTCMRSSTHVTRRHSLKSLGASLRRPRASIEQIDQGFAVLGLSALRVGLDALQPLLLRPHQARETADLLGSGRIVP
jgi:hypothetical protein